MDFLAVNKACLLAKQSYPKKLENGIHCFDSITSCYMGWSLQTLQRFHILVLYTKSCHCSWHKQHTHLLLKSARTEHKSIADAADDTASKKGMMVRNIGI